MAADFASPRQNALMDLDFIAQAARLNMPVEPQDTVQRWVLLRVAVMAVALLTAVLTVLDLRPFLGWMNWIYTILMVGGFVAAFGRYSDLLNFAPSVFRPLTNRMTTFMLIALVVVLLAPVGFWTDLAQLGLIFVVTGVAGLGAVRALRAPEAFANHRHVIRYYRSLSKSERASLMRRVEANQRVADSEEPSR